MTGCSTHLKAEVLAQNAAVQRFDEDLVLHVEVQSLHSAAGTQGLVGAGLRQLRKFPTPDNDEEVVRRWCSLRVGPTHALEDSQPPSTTLQLNQLTTHHSHPVHSNKQTDTTAGRTGDRQGDRRVPVGLRRPQQPDAAASVRFDLTLCSFDGGFEAFAEEALKDVEKNKIRRSKTKEGPQLLHPQVS